MAVGVVTLLMAAFLPTALVAAAPADAGCENRTNQTYQKLLECVTLEGVREHQAALQAIADANDDPFYPGTPRRVPRATTTASTMSRGCCGTPGMR